jgi:hypothetical protein
MVGERYRREYMSARVRAMRAPPGCREYMICPLPRANEMSAFRAEAGRAIGGKETADALCRRRRGAGYEGPRGDHAGAEWAQKLLDAINGVKDAVVETGKLAPDLARGMADALADLLQFSNVRNGGR